MASRFVTSIDKSGPFFKTNPAKTFRQNIRVLMDRVAEEGQGDVQAQLRVGESSRLPLGGRIVPGRVSAHVVGRTSALTGKRWAVTAVVSSSTVGLSRTQAIKLQAAASYLEGDLHAFRRTAGRLKRTRAVNTAELLKGIR